MFTCVFYILSVAGVCSSCCGVAAVTIPTTTTSIASDAFYQCGGGTQLISVTITT